MTYRFRTPEQKENDALMRIYCLMLALIGLEVVGITLWFGWK